MQTAVRTTPRDDLGEPERLLVVGRGRVAMLQAARRHAAELVALSHVGDWRGFRTHAQVRHMKELSIPGWRRHAQ